MYPSDTLEVPDFSSRNYYRREIGIYGANWIWLAQDRVQWVVFVSTVMNLRVP